MPPHRHVHEPTWSYRREAVAARLRRLRLRAREAPGRLVAWMRARVAGPRSGPPPAMAPTQPFENRIPTSPTVHDQATSDHCCAHAVAAAMETRIIGGQNGAAVGIPGEAVFELRPSRDLASAAEAARIGVPDSQGTKRTAKTQRLDASSDDAMCELMRRTLDQLTPLASRIKVWSNFEHFSGTGIYATSGSFVGDHAICILGYGMNAQGERYWIARNSFGAQWGDRGDVRIRWKDGNVAPELVVISIPLVTP